MVEAKRVPGGGLKTGECRLMLLVEVQMAVARKSAVFIRAVTPEQGRRLAQFAAPARRAQADTGTSTTLYTKH